MNTRKVARGLGWFSIGLGLAEVIATKKLGRFLGMEDRRGLLRFYGMREIAAGVGLLSQERLAPWLWARVAGDALDLATLGRAATGRRARRLNLGLAAGAVAGVTALDVLAGARLQRHDEAPATA